MIVATEEYFMYPPQSHSIKKEFGSRKNYELLQTNHLDEHITYVNKYCWPANRQTSLLLTTKNGLSLIQLWTHNTKTEHSTRRKCI